MVNTVLGDGCLVPGLRPYRAMGRQGSFDSMSLVALAAKLIALRMTWSFKFISWKGVWCGGLRI
jgi:hypothetical protein